MKNKSGKAGLIVTIIIIILIAAGVAYYFNSQDKLDFAKIVGGAKQVTTEIKDKGKKEVKKPKEVQSFKGYKRPYAVMLDNNIYALPHIGINDAYIIYELLVEGGETRLMALFDDKNLDMIGPVRSSRPYFLDYALENDAIYVHYGWSPQAKDDIKRLNINNLNGLEYNDSKKDNFWRIRDRRAPHNAVTSTANIDKMVNGKQYRKMLLDKKPLIEYSVDEIKLDGPQVDEIDLKFSNQNKVKWTYNKATKEYERLTRNKQELDGKNNSKYSAKNLIVYKLKYTTLTNPEDAKAGRKRLFNIGTSEGYYFTDNKVEKIKIVKDTRKGKTRYYDKNDKELKINDGRTFIEILPLEGNISFEEVSETVNNTANNTVN